MKAARRIHHLPIFRVGYVSPPVIALYIAI